MAETDIAKSIKKAIKIAFALDKVIKISKAIDDLSDGIEEIEQSLGKAKNIKEYSINRKRWYKYIVKYMINVIIILKSKLFEIHKNILSANHILYYG